MIDDLRLLLHEERTLQSDHYQSASDETIRHWKWAFHFTVSMATDFSMNAGWQEYARRGIQLDRFSKVCDRLIAGYSECPKAMDPSTIAAAVNDILRGGKPDQLDRITETRLYPTARSLHGYP